MDVTRCFVMNCPKNLSSLNVSLTPQIDSRGVVLVNLTSKRGLGGCMSFRHLARVG